MFPHGLPIGPCGRAWVEAEDAFVREHATAMTVGELARHRAAMHATCGRG